MYYLLINKKHTDIFIIHTTWVYDKTNDATVYLNTRNIRQGHMYFLYDIRKYQKHTDMLRVYTIVSHGEWNE